ncbi:MAG: hypothetical protein B7X08_04470 [Acidocella sp. 20-63-7]|nr:MAG: hypothetical protein B7X08_04470 [Acidocella sp. 20-63-7]HQT46731.1 nuclear transport factor 2 family protein [Acidocella sp.]
MDIEMDQARLYAQTVFAAVDRMDARAFADFFAADGVFAFANSPEIRGVEAVRQGVEDFFAAIASLRHEVEEVWRAGETDICRLRVTYTRHDGSWVSLSCATIWLRAEEKIVDYRIYIDLAPLFAPSGG